MFKLSIISKEYEIKIKLVGIHNSRKIKECRIPLGGQVTLFFVKIIAVNIRNRCVNSFLDTENKQRLSVIDFTLNNCYSFNKYA
jgi:hypothetical protein